MVFVTHGNMLMLYWFFVWNLSLQIPTEWIVTIVWLRTNKRRCEKWIFLTTSLRIPLSRLWQGWDSETSGEKSISEIWVIMTKLVSWVMDCTKVQTQWLLEWLLSVKVHRDFYQWPISILIGYLYVYLLYYISSLHNSTAVVACWTTDHWVAGSNPLRGVFVFNVTSLFPVLSSVQLRIHNVYTGGLTNIISFSFLYIPAVITK